MKAFKSWSEFRKRRFGCLDLCALVHVGDIPKSGRPCRDLGSLYIGEQCIPRVQMAYHDGKVQVPSCHRSRSRGFVSLEMEEVEGINAQVQWNMNVFSVFSRTCRISRRKVVRGSLHSTGVNLR